VRRTPDETLFDGLIETHHYLGYTQPVLAIVRKWRILDISPA
jgi:hypothetical protein